MNTPLGAGAEFDLIRAILARSRASRSHLPPQVLAGPGDDCAVLHVGRLAVSVDMAVEGVHFRRDWLTPEEIGYRTGAAALSDLAAVAATPRGMLVAAAVPDADRPGFILHVMAGVHAAAADAGTAVLGGDLARTAGPLVLDAVVLGEAERPVLRRGAVAGDHLWVTGRLGGAAAAVYAWNRQSEPDPAARQLFAHPTPRLAEAEWLAGRVDLHALIDISDGLAGDAGHLAAASGVHIVLDPGALPGHPAVAGLGLDTEQALRLVLGGGDDYELCFAAAPGSVAPLVAEFAAKFGVELTCVGRVTAGEGVALEQPGGGERALDFRGFDHFQTPAS